MRKLYCPWLEKKKKPSDGEKEPLYEDALLSAQMACGAIRAHGYQPRGAALASVLDNISRFWNKTSPEYSEMLKGVAAGILGEEFLQGMSQQKWLRSMLFGHPGRVGCDGNAKVLNFPKTGSFLFQLSKALYSRKYFIAFMYPDEGAVHHPDTDILYERFKERYADLTRLVNMKGFLEEHKVTIKLDDFEGKEVSFTGGILYATKPETEGSAVVPDISEEAHELWITTVSKQMDSLVRKVVETVYACVAESTDWSKNKFYRALHEVSRVHRLTVEEEYALSMLYGWQELGLFSEYPFSTDKRGKKEEFPKRLPIRMFATMLATSMDRSPGKAFMKFLHKRKGSLVTKGVILRSDDGSDSSAEHCYTELDPLIVEYLVDAPDPKKQPYTSTTTKLLGTEDALPIDRFGLSEQAMHVLDTCMERGDRSICKGGKGVHVLIHGHPGTGKTELVKSLAQKHGRLIQSVLVSPEIGEMDSMSPRSRFNAVRLCSMNLQPGDMLMIDEADRVLNGGRETNDRIQDDTVPKDTLNDFMDTTPGLYLWVVNATYDIAPSVMRRFDYVLHMGIPDQETRVKLVSSVCEHHRLPEVPDKLLAMAKKYPLTPACMVKVVQMCKSSKTLHPEVLEELVKSHLDATQGRWSPEKDTGFQGYDPSLLNVLDATVPLGKLPGQVQRFIDMPADKKQRLGATSFGVLLSGPPGTGKTEWARYLARTLEKPFTEVLASSLQDKYVGGTEENIRRMFEAAEKKKGVLFIDEVDALLLSRDTAEKSWEISATEQFMNCMENYKGVLVCATNFAENMDKAVNRRFQVCLRFGYLTSESAAKMLRDSFDMLDLGALDDVCLGKIKGLQLTPSDFGVTRKRLAFEDPSEITQQTFITYLLDAASSRNGKRHLGF